MFNWFKKSHKDIVSEQRQQGAIQSNAVRALNRQIEIMQGTIDFLTEDVEYYRGLSRERNSQTMEDRLLDIGMNLLMPKEKQIQKTLRAESGKILSDEEIKNWISKLNKEQKTQLCSVPLNMAVNHIKKNVPDISDESIIKGIEMIKNEN